jgi:hypothetical protein
MDRRRKNFALTKIQNNVARRTLSNTLGLWHFCARSHCQRAQCCPDEPLECMRVGLPLLPETLAALAQRKGKRKRASAVP